MNGHDTLTGYDFTVDHALSRPQAVREYCKMCIQNEYPISCTMEDCPLWPYRSHRAENPSPGRVKAIKRHCFECSGCSHNELNKCGIVDCHLWPYRKGSATASGGVPAISRAAKKQNKTDSEG